MDAYREVLERELILDRIIRRDLASEDDDTLGVITATNQNRPNLRSRGSYAQTLRLDCLRPRRA